MVKFRLIEFFRLKAPSDEGAPRSGGGEISPSTLTGTSLIRGRQGVQTKQRRGGCLSFCGFLLSYQRKNRLSTRPFIDNLFGWW